MFGASRVFRVVAVVALAGMSLLHPFTSRAAGEPVLVDQRVLTIEDTRIIGISPDGTAVAAASWNRDELCVFEVATLERRFCTDLEPLDARLRLNDVHWSPDSSKLALVEESFKLLIDGDLWVLDAFTGELTNLTDEPYRGDVYTFGADEEPPAEVFLDVAPAWLPDSSGITFSRSIWRDGETAGNAIYTVPVAGGPAELETIVTLDMPGVVYFGTAWTEDRSAFYYSLTSLDSSDPRNGIWRVNADGLDATQVIGADETLGSPILAGLSPDGDTLLAYYVMAAGQFSSTADYFYALVDTATGAVTPVIPEDDLLGRAMTAVLSPNGDYVAYVTIGGEPAFQVFVRPVAGGDETALVPNGVPNGAVPVDLAAPITWSDTGVLLFTTSLLSQATLLTIDLTGAATPRITPESTQTPSPTATLEPTATATATTAPTEMATVAPTATPEPTATPSPTATPQPALGDVVYVNDNDVPLRAAPGVDEETILTLARGAELHVLGDPVDADGFTWIPVGDLAATSVGYVRAEFLDRTED